MALRKRLAPVAALALLFGVACGTAKLVGAGGDCFVATDCDLGLACVPQANGHRVCSSDLTNVAFGPDASEAAAPVADATAPDGDATVSKPDSSAQPDTSVAPDTSVPDTSVPDTSIPDTGNG